MPFFLKKKKGKLKGIENTKMGGGYLKCIL
jgi:hypothetical protein